MMYQLAIEPEAEEDLAEAYRWYENQRPGLGDEFIACVDAGLERICERPELHAVVYKNVRQALIRRFPYVLCYVFEEPRGRRDRGVSWSPGSGDLEIACPRGRLKA